MLHTNSLKKTRRRQAVIQVLKDSTTPLSAQEIHRRAIVAEPMSLSTAYRFLGVLTETGRILKTPQQDGQAYYQLPEARHKHQLICTSCQRTQLLESCPLRDMEAQLAEETGFFITGHSLEFSGLCPCCRDKKL